MPTIFLAGSQNFVEKTLSGSITDSVGTITLNSTSAMLAPGYIVIDRLDSSGVATPSLREVVSYTGISGTDLTGCTRGADGSTAQSHADAAKVEVIPTVGLFNSLATIVSTAMTSDSYIKAINSPVSLAYIEAKTLSVSSIASIPRVEGANAVFTSTVSVPRIESAQAAFTSIVSIGQLEVTQPILFGNGTQTGGAGVGGSEFVNVPVRPNSAGNRSASMSVYFPIPFKTGGTVLVSLLTGVIYKANSNSPNYASGASYQVIGDMLGNRVGFVYFRGDTAFLANATVSETVSMSVTYSATRS